MHEAVAKMPRQQVTRLGSNLSKMASRIFKNTISPLNCEGHTCIPRAQRATSDVDDTWVDTIEMPSEEGFQSVARHCRVI